GIAWLAFVDVALVVGERGRAELMGLLPAADALVEVEEFFLADNSGLQRLQTVLHAHVVPRVGRKPKLVDAVNVAQVVPVGPAGGGDLFRRKAAHVKGREVGVDKRLYRT